MFILLNWLDTTDYKDLSFILTKDGDVRLFNTMSDALNEAEQINGRWKVVEV